MVAAPVSFEPPVSPTLKAEGTDNCALPDPLLLPFLQAANDDQAREILCQLLHTHVDPIIGAAVYLYAFTNPGVLQRRKSSYEEDVRSEIFRLLMMRLMALRSGNGRAIADFRAYAKLTARHECYRYLRRASREKPFSTFVQDEETANDGFMADAEDPAQVLDLVLKRDGLRDLWQEIMCLPSGQRDALLLSVRDGEGMAVGSMSAVTFFLHCGVVTRKELSKALNVENEQLHSLLKQLPFCDCTIAERMGNGVSAIAVKNMRTAARRRLERRVPFVSM